MKSTITRLSVAASTLLASSAFAAPPAHDAQSTPSTSPASYANLAFTAVTPCRIMDTRVSQGGSGPWLAGTSNQVKIGPYATGYASGPGAQGGSPTGCGLDTLAGPGEVAAILAAVSTLNQAGSGFLSFYPESTLTPTSVSMRYQPGFTQVAFVLIPTNLVGTVSAYGNTSTTTEVLIDVVGYYSAADASGVTSVSTGTGLTGGPITSTGTLSIATAFQLPQACATNQIPKWGGSAWTCATDANSGGTVTAVTASAPLQTTGSGTAPNVSFATATFGQLLASTGGAPVFTGSPSISGNLTLATDPSTSTAGNIMKGPYSFIHNFGNANTFVGEMAGNFTMTGNYNAVLGNGAFAANTSGTVNTAIGSYALTANTTGGGNSASGAQALYSNTTGSSNTATGFNALYANTTGNLNTAAGTSALTVNTGSNNTALGFETLRANTIGGQNTAVGLQALYSNTTGSGNIAIGGGAGGNITTGSDNIFVAHPGGAAAEVGTIRIGFSGTQTRAFVAGIRGVTTGVNNAVAVVIDGSGQLGTLSSSRQVKDDIADMDTASNALMKLRPVTFHYKSDQAPAGRRLQYGLIAEEVEKVYPGLIAHSNDGKVETVMYQFLPPMLLNEYQKQAGRIAGLERERLAQAARIDALERRLAKLVGD